MSTPKSIFFTNIKYQKPTVTFLVEPTRRHKGAKRPPNIIQYNKLYPDLAIFCIIIQNPVIGIGRGNYIYIFSLIFRKGNGLAT